MLLQNEEVIALSILREILYELKHDVGKQVLVETLGP
jgi:hypothetical protein